MLDFQLVSYFTNFAVQNVNNAFVYVTDLTSTLTQTEVLIIPHILQEPNPIIVLLFICIFIGLRVNACIVNKNTQATKPFVFSRFWHK